MTAAVLTRTRNIDYPSHGTKEQQTLWSRNTGENIEMGIANANAIYAMLSDLSATPGQYVLREAYSNAYDATMRTGDMSLAIEIDLPERMDMTSITSKLNDGRISHATLRITDHGCGMSKDEVCSNFLQYGGSDKLDEIDSIGSKGLGAKAPLAIAESFDLITTKNGITTTAHITRRPQAAGIATVHSEYTGNSSGTTVAIPIMRLDILDQMWEFANSLKHFATGVNLVINGETIKSALKREIGETTDNYVCLGEITVNVDPPTQMYAWQYVETDYSGYYNFPRKCQGTNDTVSICALVGGVLYPITRHDTHIPVYIVEVDPGWLDFTPSRDEVKKTPETEEFTNRIKDGLSHINFEQILTAYIDKAKAKTLLSICAQSEFDEDVYVYTPRRYRNSEFEFIRSKDNSTHLRIRSLTYAIPEETYQRIRNIKFPYDVISLTHIGSSERTSLNINGKDVRKSEAIKLIGVTTSKACAKALIDKKTTINIIHGVTSQNDTRWIIKNEANLRNANVIHWNTNDNHAAIIIIDDLATIDPIIAECITNAHITHIEDAQETIKNLMRERRENRRIALEKQSAQSIENAAWSMTTVSYHHVPRNLTEEEILLAILQPDVSRMQKARTNTLQKLSTPNGPHNIAIAIIDEDQQYRSCLHSVACGFAFYRHFHPNEIPTEIEYVAVVDTKHISVKDFKLLIENGAFLIGDKRTKIKSVMKNGLIDRAGEDFQMQNDGSVTIDMSKTQDYRNLARTIQFARTIGFESMYPYDINAVRILLNTIDTIPLNKNALEAVTNAHTTFNQYRIIQEKNMHGYGMHDVTIVMTLCNHDIAENSSIYRYVGSPCILMKNVPTQTKQIIEDTIAVSKYMKNTLEAFGASPMSSAHNPNDATKQRMRAFGTILAYDMNEHFERKVH